MSRAGTAVALLLAALGLACDFNAGTKFRECPDCPLMVVIPAGAFDMGSPGKEQGNGDEFPQHRVTLTRPFAIGAYEVTRGEFARFVAATNHQAADDCNILVNEEWKSTPGVSWRNPGFAQGDDEPVVCVNWLDAQAYAKWMAAQTHRPYRLMSEAEWEYVARRGSGTRTISHDRANYGAETCCGRKKEGRDRWEYTAPVGSFPADGLGVHDVLGNVWEWLEDCYHESYEGSPLDGSPRTAQCSSPDKRIVRGGGYGDASWLLRPGYRLRGPIDGRYATLGFRIARTLE